MRWRLSKLDRICTLVEIVGPKVWVNRVLVFVERIDRIGHVRDQVVKVFRYRHIIQCKTLNGQGGEKSANRCKRIAQHNFMVRLNERLGFCGNASL